MTFLNPSGLFWGLLAVPIVALYLWRVRPPRRSVPAGFLWDRVFSRDRPRAAWWPWRRPVSLIVELAILALLVFALAEPLVRPPQRVVLILDNSAANVGVTGLAARRSLCDPWRCEILVRVTSYCDEPVACRVELDMEGEPIVDVSVHLPAAGHWQRMFEITTASGGRIAARLDRPDPLADDNCGSTLLLPIASPILMANLLPWGEASDGRIGACRAEGRPAAAWPARAEGDLRVPAPLAASRPKPAVADAAGPPLWLYPAAAALLLVVLQWCLSQRRWVC